MTDELTRFSTNSFRLECHSSTLINSKNTSNISVLECMLFIKVISGSCHLDRASNVEIGVECQTFVIFIILTATEFYNLGHIQGIIGCINSKYIMFCNLYYFQI